MKDQERSSKDNISELRPRAEDASRASELRYRRLFESAQDGILILDFDTGTILDVNPYLIEMLGYSHEEFVEKYLWEVSPFKDTDLNKEAFAKLQQAGYVRYEDLPLETSDGRKIAVEFVSNSYPVNGKTFIQCNIRDITKRKWAEQGLQESEERYRFLFAQMKSAVAVYKTENDGEDFIFVDFNKAAEEVEHIPKEKVSGQNVLSVFSKVKESGMFEVFQRVWRSGNPEHHAVTQYVDDRIEGWRDNFVYKLPTGEIVAIYSDETERKKSEERLRESEARYKAVVDNLEIGISLLNSKMEIVAVNKAMKRYFPHILPASGQVCYEHYNSPPRSSPCSYCPCVQTFQDGMVHETITETPAGSEIRHYNLVSSPIKDASGRVQYVIELTDDITERKRTQEALKQSERRYRTLFEESIDGVYSVLRDGEITDANTSFCELFGYKREEMIGKDSRELYFDPADHPRFQKEIEEKGFVKDYAVKFRKRDGTEKDCLLTSSVYYREDGSITGYRGIIRDVTDQKRLQRQLVQSQKMESIGTLAGGIAHDFNNLLTVVLGFSELLLIGKDERDPSYGDLQKIHQAARHGADLVSRILAFSKKAQINPRPLNLNHEIERIQNLLTRTIAKMIEIELVLSNEPAIVHVDPMQLEQVVLNLAVNAQDAMPDGGKLTFETTHVTLDEEYCGLNVGAKPGDYVMLSVSDTGHGMDHETLNHIFEPFYTTKETGKGTGLGLAMVYGIVKQHGGYIIGYSEPRMGTTFKIYLPVIPTEKKPETPTKKLILSRGTETVLLVDDEEMVSDLGKRILERFGYTVLTAANGKEALDLYEKERNKISLVILDLIMPEMGGRQCLEELLKIDPPVKVLIASGYSAVGETKKTIESGAMGFVGKPYDIGQMLQAVRQVLDQDLAE